MALPRRSGLDDAGRPPAEQIEAWLGDFRPVTLRRRLTPRERDSASLPSSEVARQTAWIVVRLGARMVLANGILFLLAAIALGSEQALPAWVCVMLLAAAVAAVTPLPRADQAEAAPRVRLPVVIKTRVSADARGVCLATEGAEQTLAWAELVEVQHHGDDALLCSEYGEALRLPRTSLLQPVLRAAGHVVAARRAHDQALAVRMERGLSRPEHDERADRGLSVTGGG